MKSEAILRPGVGEALLVKCLTDIDGARWDRFVMETRQAGFFHLSGWARVIEKCFSFPTYFLYAERGGRIEGVLPLAHVESWLTGRALVSLPFCIEAGLVAVSEEAAGALEREAMVIASQLSVERLELRHRVQRFADWPRQDLYVRFEKPVADSDEANLAAIPRKQRAVVRKGIAAGLIDQVDEQWDRFFSLYADNTRRHGSPAQGRRYFEMLREVFGPACEVLTVCDAGGAPLSSVLSFYFRDAVLPYYAGDVASARATHANDFKYWALMKRARARGVRIFDYGRSKVGSGSFSFKKNWGCEPQPLFYEFCLFDGGGVLPQHHPNNPKYRALIAAWKRLPLAVTTRLGPHLVRHFG